MPALFDRYDAFEPRPSLYFALSVVRRPAPDTATLFGGGYLASGPAGKDRLPCPATPGLELLGTEGAGEVQTPVRLPAGLSLAPGDPLLFRHAKAGELCERFNELLLIEDGRVVDTAPTYRGDGRCFF